MSKLIFLLSAAGAAAVAAAYPHLRVHPGSIEWAGAEAVAHVNTWALALLGQLLPRAWMWRIPNWASASAIVGAVGFILIFVTLRAGGALLRRAAPGKSKRSRGSDKAPAAPQKTSRGIRVNSKIMLPPENENLGTFCLGSTQTGKSQILAAAAIAARERGAPAIVPCQEDELFEGLYDPAIDVVLNPFDARGVAWSPLAELRNAAEISNLAQGLVPVASDPREETWRGFGRDLLSGLISYVWDQGGTNADLRRLVVSAEAEKELESALVGTDGEALLRPGSETMLSNALSTAGAIAKPIGLGAPEAGRDAWSVRSWIDEAVRRADAGERAGFLWITAPEEVSVAVLPLLNVISTLAVTHILRAPANRARRIFYILDEMGTLGEVGGLDKALVRGAKRGLSCFAAAQSIEQLRSPRRYGRSGAASLLSCFNQLFVFRCNDQESAEWAEKTFGKRHVTRTLQNTSKSTSSNSSRTGGSTGSSSTASTNQHHSIEAAVLDSQISALPKLTAFVRLPGMGVFGPVGVDYYPMSSQHPFFIPADETVTSQAVAEARKQAAKDEVAAEIAPTESAPGARGQALERGADDLMSALDSLGGGTET